MHKHLKSEKKHLTAIRHFGRRYRLMIAISFIFIVFGFFQNSPSEISKGLFNIISKPDTLICDYIILGNMGAAFVNSGLLTLIFTLILFRMRMRLTGANFAGLFMIMGFAFLGKNLVNVWFPIIGVKLYSLAKKEPLSHYIVPALFSTAMSPMVSEIMFFPGLNPIYAIPVAVLSGIILGFVLSPIASAMVNVHQGLNLYNVGFAAGIIVTIYLSVLKSYGFTTHPQMMWSTGHNVKLGIFLVLLFLGIFIYGFILNKRSTKGWLEIQKYPGRLITDFIILEGLPATFMNMGTMGLIGVSYILFIGGDLNGPTMAGIFAIAGFGAMGKHPKNVIPVLLGIVLAASTHVFEINDPAIQLAALFGSSLAPITGIYGVFWGVVAGFLHSSLSQYVGYLHGGINLYNNGFSTGIVAATIAPLIEAFRKERR